MDDQLARTAKAIHTLFYATERAGQRYRELEASIEGDDELAAFQALGIGLINFDPPPPRTLERMAARLEEWDRQNEPPPPSPRVTVEPGSSGEEASYFKRLLDRMYARWDGTLDYERGIHRLSFYSPFDEQGRRHTSFAQVYVDGETSEVRCRSYTLGPYLLVADYRTKVKSDDPWKVLNGDLSPILPPGAVA